MEVFKDYAYYYNAFYQDKDYKLEAEQIDYLFSRGLLEKYEPCGAFWEYSGMGEYWQFTDKGRRWRNWYVCSFWQWVFFHGLKLYRFSSCCKIYELIK